MFPNGFRLIGLAICLACMAELVAADPPQRRRILYNLDGDSCMTLRAGRKGPGPLSTNDLIQLIQELKGPGSQVDTLLICVNAQVMYYPTKVGTMRGTLSTPDERAKWPAHEQQRFANLKAFFDAGVDPYAFLIAEGRRRGLEVLLTFRMNDAHGNDFLRTVFWRDHPECRLPNGAVDFEQVAARDYVFRLIEEAVLRYEPDGIELDFQRFPTFFRKDSPLAVDQRVEKVNEIVRRVRRLMDAEGSRRGRRLMVSARAPSDYGRSSPEPEKSRALGCDPVAWAANGWIDFLTISQFLFTRYDLPIRPWKDRITTIPVYGGIECAEGGKLDQCLTPARYRKAARHLWADGADGIYLFNFFTTREWGEEGFEPPFEVMSQLGSVETLLSFPIGPWETNRPIVQVRKELYQRHPAPRAAAMTAVQYVGPGLERREWRATERMSDVADSQAARWSSDNGRTWSDWVPQEPSSLVDYGGVKVTEGGWADVHDPRSGLLVQAWLRQIEIRGVFHNVSHIRTSGNLGKTWSEPEMLRYEDGPGFDRQQPTNAVYLQRNQGYPGNNIALLSDGTLVLCLAHANAPGDPRNQIRPWRLGSVLFLGRWNPDKRSHEWRAGARVEIPAELSARGLMEPEVAELSDKRLLVVWRGSNTGWDGTVAKAPGRKWFSISSDGGRTLSPVQEWRYADGSSFYSPSSIHRMFRSGATGRLYWIGNICMTPPRGNSPRHPLVIAEVDESATALRRETVSVIDDRAAWHGADVQFSNFSLMEDRETREILLHLTTYGQEASPADWATADSYRYVLTLK